MDATGASNRAAGVDPNAPEEGDWRAQLHHEVRTRIVSKIREAMNKHLPAVSTLAPTELYRLQKLAVWFEEKSYTVATNQSEYLRKIALRILSMDTEKLTKTLQGPGSKAQVTPNQKNPSPGRSGAMDANGGASGRAAGVDPNAIAPAGADWRAQLHHRTRTRTISKLMEAMKKDPPVVSAGLDELVQRLAVRFEEKSYAEAINQSDYFRKMSLKILFMETYKARQTPRNAEWRRRKGGANKKKGDYPEHGHHTAKKQKTGGSGAASAPAK